MNPPTPEKRVLLADDEPLIRKLARNTLAGQDLQILEASNGLEALTLARDHKPDLIVLDVRMPGKSGIEVCRTLRQDPTMQSVPIILLTGQDRDEDIREAQEAGANHFFSKPFSPLQFLAKVQEYLSPPMGGTKQSPTGEFGKTIAPPAGSAGVSPRGAEADTRNPQDPDELRHMEREQLLLYAADLSKVYREEQQKREELKLAYEKLREMEKMKDMFVSLVSHELRTPLSIIKGYVSLMEQILKSAEVGGELKRFTDSIRRAADRLEVLIMELLDFSKMKHGLVHIIRKEVHLPALVGLAVDEISTLSRSRNVEVNVAPMPDMRPVRADPERLRDALVHVIKNAVLFNNPGGRVDIDFVDDGLWARVRVVDTGVGIAENEVEKIFTPFYQVEDFMTRRVDGLGLGLSITRHIVEDHGGSIEVTSKVGQGTTFMISFPRTYRDAREMVAEFTSQYPEKLQELSSGLATTERQLLAYAQELSEMVSAESLKARRLEENLREMEQTYLQTIAAVATMVDRKDAYVTGHTDRVAYVCRNIARRLNPSLLMDRNFTLALLLHDLGKIGIAEDLLQKADRLTDEEWAIVRSHVEIGTQILSPITFLGPALTSVRSHHERWDGKGYPDGLRGDEIPLPARIIAVADAFEAMTSDRPYRKGMDPELARQEISRTAGTQFDPRVVDAFLEAWDDISRVQTQQEPLVPPEVTG